MNSLLSMCLNEIKSFKKWFFFNNLNARPDHGRSVITNYVIKADDVKLNTRQRHFKGDTVHEAVFVQNRKFRLICLNLASTCSSRPN